MKFTYQQLKKFFIGILMSLMLASCYKDKFDMNMLETGGEWNPEVAAPLIYSNMSMKDILNDYDYNNLFVEDNTHFLYLVYWNKVYSKTASEIFTFQDQNINTAFSFNIIGNLPYGTDISSTPYTIQYSFTTPENIELDEIYLTSGQLQFSIYSPDINHNATINISIPSAKLDGVSLNKNIDYVYGTNTSYTIDLSGYNITFDNSGPVKNILEITYTITLHGNGNPNNSPYNIMLNEAFRNLKFGKIFGDFKQINFVLPNDSVRIRLFDHNIHGMIDFENPKVHVYATNSFGMPIQISLNNFHATSGFNPPYDVLVTGIPIPWNINAPTLSQIGQSASTEFHLTKSNSNVAEAIAISPQWFLTDVYGISNPGGGPSDNFALSQSRFDIDVQVELPLHGRAWDFILQDTLELKFGDDLDKMEYIEFRININNGFPVEAIGQVYFLDENDQKIDSLLTPAQQYISPALSGPGPDYMVYQSSNKKTETVLYKDRLIRLKNTKKVLVQSRLLTSQNGTQIVKIYSFYNLEVRVAARAKFNLTY